MITPVVMPQMGLEVTEGTVVTVAVVPGQAVASGELLLELETDKALTDVTAPRDAVVARVDVAEGDVVPLGAVLVVLSDGEPVEAEPAATPPEATAPAAAGTRVNAAAPATRIATSAADVAAPARGDAPEPPRNGRNAHGRLRVAPVARRAAASLRIDLESVPGTGPRGRITLADVERASARTAPAQPTSAASATPAPPAAPATAASAESNGFVELVALSSVRRAIARRMTVSQSIPQFSLSREIDATWLLATKAGFAAAAPGAARPGVNDMLAQALGELVMRHPALATVYVEDGVAEPSVGRRAGGDIGLAVATDRGLAVPVLRHAHERTLAELAAERVRLVGDARGGRLRGQDMRGASVTISNLGAFGIDRFVAMLNPGEAAILAVGRVLDRVRPDGRGVAVVPTLTLTLTIDHRVLDGATGASALSELCGLLEGEMTWRI